MASRNGKAPPPHLAARQQRVREAMAELKIDALLLTHGGDLAWLTDFTGDDSIGVVTARAITLVTDFRYEEQAQIESPWLKRVIRTGKMSDALMKVLGRSPGAVGFEANFTTVGQIDALKRAYTDKKRKAPRLKAVRDVLVNLRKTKDASEIDTIRRAARIAEEAFKAIRRLIRPGITESELAATLILEMRKRGASGGSFDAIVAAGPASSLPHYRPGMTAVEWNQPLLFDWGARYNGYCSDITRTLLLGKPPKKVREIYAIVLEAQLAAIDAIRPGVESHKVDAVARKIIKKAGYGKYFGHGLGHGIGRDIHELPVLRKNVKGEELRPGHVVTVEPGIYLPGVGGVRIEDDVLVTETGREVLTSLPKSMEQCSI
jgi:Xaa-Pro aminopeptidase